MTEPICNRCGKCCHFVIEGRLRACKFLVKLPGGKTLCRIYNAKDRLGREIYPGVYCNKIEDIKTNFEGCPFNKPGQKEADW